jgi:SAM-dependent methyltransferase
MKNDNGHNYTFPVAQIPWHPKRDYIFIDRYLDELAQDVYPQPPDIEHTKQAKAVIDKWIPDLDVTNVLDVGCGEGFCQPFFEEYKILYLGICLGEDVEKAAKAYRAVVPMDFHFIGYKDIRYDLIFARHALEHSPMPILALMEWHRVAKKYLILVLPKPKFWLFVGRNHYSVVTGSQARFLLHRSGWEIVEEDFEHEWEYRFLCKKVVRQFDPDEGYNWAYKDEELEWLDMAEPTKEEEEVEV